MTGPRVLIGGHRRTTKLQGAGVRMGTERPQQSEGGLMGFATEDLRKNLYDVFPRK